MLASLVVILDDATFKQALGFPLEAFLKTHHPLLMKGDRKIG